MGPIYIVSYILALGLTKDISFYGFYVTVIKNLHFTLVSFRTWHVYIVHSIRQKNRYYKDRICSFVYYWPENFRLQFTIIAIKLISVPCSAKVKVFCLYIHVEYLFRCMYE